MSLKRRTPWRPPVPRSGAEDGQGLIAVLVLFTIVSFVGFSFSRWVTSDLNNTGNVVNTSQARTMAEAGLADAMFRIDQQAWSSPSSFCVGPAPCTVPSIPGAPGLQYTARYANSVYTILSQGVSHSRKYAIQATVTKTPGFFAYAMFGVSQLNFSGDNNNIRSTDQNGNPTGGPAPVGTDGSVLCSTGVAGTEQDIFGAGSGCNNTVHMAGTYSPQLPVASCPAPANVPLTPCMPSGPQACPNGGVFDGTASPYVLQPGVYLCTGSLKFSGTVNVNYGSSANGGRVQIYLFPANGQTTTSIDMGGAVVNQYVSAGVIGDPTALQIYDAGGAGSTFVPGANAAGAKFDGMLYAPKTDSTGFPTMTGSVVLNSWDTSNAQGNTWTAIFNLDTRVANLGGGLSSATLKDFAQIPTSQFSIP